MWGGAVGPRAADDMTPWRVSRPLVVFWHASERAPAAECPQRLLETFRFDRRWASVLPQPERSCRRLGNLVAQIPSAVLAMAVSW